MSFAIRNLSVLAYANGFTLWHYKASGTGLAGILDGGYFQDAADMLTSGDVIYVRLTNWSVAQRIVVVGSDGVVRLERLD